MATQVSRDPYARETTYRKRVYVEHATCAWCGSQKQTPTGRPYLFEYSTESDGGRTSTDRRLFCGIGCRGTYFN